MLTFLVWSEMSGHVLPLTLVQIFMFPTGGILISSQPNTWKTNDIPVGIRITLYLVLICVTANISMQTKMVTSETLPR